ncbi:MAG: hypothetical protein CVU80_00945, partial [Elusimicrobia bacterium HGW-Elusimicrobia-4]
MKKFFFLAFIVPCCLSLVACYLHSATPSTIKYQGVLREKGALVNGKKTMKFRITDADGNNPVYVSGNVDVTVTQGAFSCELTPAGINWKTGDYYLEVTIGGQLLSPREKICSTVYALQAKSVDSVAWSDITDKPTDTTTDINDLKISTGTLDTNK